MGKRNDGWDLTEDEKAFLRSSSRVPQEIKDDMSRQAGNVGVEISTFTKLAQKYRREAEMLAAFREREKELGKASSAEDWKKDSINARSELKRVIAELEEFKRQNLALKVAPSMAVHSQD